MTRPMDSMTRILLALLGSFMLLMSIVEALTPRARYRESSPEPGSVLATPPAQVTVHFSRELALDSTIHVVCTVSVLPSDERLYSGGEDVVAESGLDPNDPSHRSLRAVLRPGLLKGLYRVDWSVLAARGRTERFGSYYFGVGMSVPDSVARDLGGPLRERGAYDLEGMSPRVIPLGGILLIALAILLPRLRPHRWHDME